MFFFFNQKTSYEMRISDWSSDVCSSDLFWWQRVTAVVLALLVPWLVGTLVSFIGADLATVHSVLSTPLNAILLAAFVLALFWHAKLGMQVVIEYYVHTRALEVALQLVVMFACGFGALASLRSEEHTSELQSLMRN